MLCTRVWCTISNMQDNETGNLGEQQFAVTLAQVFMVLDLDNKWADGCKEIDRDAT